MSPANRVPTWRTVAHVILVLTLVFNLRLNINLNQTKEGRHMAHTIKSQLHTHCSQQDKAVDTKKRAETDCMGARARRSG